MTPHRLAEVGTRPRPAFRQCEASQLSRPSNHPLITRAATGDATRRAAWRLRLWQGRHSLTPSPWAGAPREPPLDNAQHGWQSISPPTYAPPAGSHERRANRSIQGG
eukprot:8923320-Pyramimonas_sp.AAC.1